MNKETMIGTLRGKYKFTSVTETQCALNDIAEWIDHAEKVVRCNDCKHYNVVGCHESFGWCEYLDRGMMDDKFCSFGEKKVKT